MLGAASGAGATSELRMAGSDHQAVEADRRLADQRGAVDLTRPGRSSDSCPGELLAGVGRDRLEHAAEKVERPMPRCSIQAPSTPRGRAADGRRVRRSCSRRAERVQASEPRSRDSLRAIVIDRRFLLVVRLADSHRPISERKQGALDRARRERLSAPGCCGTARGPFRRGPPGKGPAGLRAASSRCSSP